MIGQQITQVFYQMKQAFLYSRKKYSSAAKTEPGSSSQKKYLMLKKFSNNKPTPVIIRQTSPTSSDNAKSIPNNIIYDKQALYMEVQQLKKAINKLTNQNMKLKTRIAVYQSQRIRINKNRYYELNDQNNMQQHGGAALMVNSSHLDNLKNDVLRRQVKQLKLQLELQKKENARIKHTIKYSKINELDVQIKTLIEENKSLYDLFQQAKSKNKAIQYLQHLGTQQKVKSLIKQNKSYATQIQNLNIEIMNLQSQLRKQKALNNSKDCSSRYENSEERRTAFNKLRDIIDFRRLQNSASIIESKIHSARAKEKDIQSSFKAHHMHLQNIRKNYMLAGNSIPKLEEKRQNSLSQQQNQKAGLIDENEKLRFKLSFTERRLSQIEEKIAIYNTTTTQIQSKTSAVPIIQEKIDKEETMKQEEQLEEKQEPPKPQNNNFFTYQQQIIQEKQKQPQQQPKRVNIEANLRKINSQKRFNEQQSEESQHQVLQPNKMQTQYLKEKIHSFSQSKKIYNNKMLKELKQLLTYRFMCQRYKFADLKKDIQSSNEKQLSYVDVCHMLVNEPFFLNVEYCKVLATFIFDIFDREKPKQDEIITISQLLIKLRKMIKEYQQLNKQKECILIDKCVHLVRLHGKSLKQQFQLHKKQSNTVEIAKLRQILTKYQFSREEIEYMIAQVSIDFNDLQNIPYELILERFSIAQSSRSSKHPKQQVILQREEEQQNTYKSRKSLINRSFLNSRNTQRKRKEMENIKAPQNQKLEDVVNREDPVQLKLQKVERDAANQVQSLSKI